MKTVFEDATALFADTSALMRRARGIRQEIEQARAAGADEAEGLVHGAIAARDRRGPRFTASRWRSARHRGVRTPFVPNLSSGEGLGIGGCYFAACRRARAQARERCASVSRIPPLERPTEDLDGLVSGLGAGLGDDRLPLALAPWPPPHTCSAALRSCGPAAPLVK